MLVARMVFSTDFMMKKRLDLGENIIANSYA